MSALAAAPAPDALASMPKFAGGAVRDASAQLAAAPPLPAPRAARRIADSGTVAGLAVGKVDAEEEVRRAQRASRFGVPPASTSLPAQLPRSPAPLTVLSRPVLAAGSAFSFGDGMGDDARDDDGENLSQVLQKSSCEQCCILLWLQPCLDQSIMAIPVTLPLSMSHALHLLQKAKVECVQAL